MLPASTLVYLSFLASLTSLASAITNTHAPAPLSVICAQSCSRVLGGVTFNGAKVACQNTLYSESLFICTKVYCSEDDVAVGLANLNATCLSRSKVGLPSYSIISNFTEAQIAAVQRVEASEVKALGKSVSKIVIPAEDYYLVAYDSTLDKRNSVVHSIDYGYAMYAFWALVCCFGIFNQLLLLGKSMRDHVPVIDEEGIIASQAARKLGTFGRIRHWTRTHITVPAMFGHARAKPVGWCTVPSRVQSLTIAAFVVLNIVLLLVDYPLFNGNIVYTTKRLQVAQYIGDRTGILALANLPLVWIFSSRNDILLWITGWSFATFNRFHRWVARIVTAQAIAHAVAYTFQLIYQKGKARWLAEVSENYYYTGIVAVVLMAFLMPLSMYGLRNRYYEIFLYTHITAAVGVLIGIFYHIDSHWTGEYSGYFWACVAIWGFDRLLRLARVFVLNIPGRRTQARAIYDVDGDVVRLEVEPTVNVHPRPGTYYYIYVLHGWHFYESHPFTLSSWRLASQDSSVRNPSSPASLSTASFPHEKKGATAAITSASPTSSHPSSLSPASAPTKPTLSFLIRPVAGFTRRLRKLALQGNPSAPTPLSILIEGPYGTPAPINSFENVLYIVGGTGITVALAYLRESANKHADGLRSVKLVWVARQRALITDVAGHELAELGRGGLKVEGYVTDESKAEGEGNEVDGVEMFGFRPDVDALVLAEAERTSGSLAVVVCGPAGMADDVRRAVVRALKRGWAGVELFEESFTW